MSLQALPVELLLVLSEHLPSNALAALALTCSAFCPVAQRILYRHVSVSAWSRNLSVVLLLAKNQNIARYVRSFYIAIDTVSPVFRPYYCMLAKAILNMSELHSLDLFVDSSASWILREARARTEYPNLAHFTCTFPLDDLVVNFLQKTPSLLELEVDSIPTMLTRNTPLPSLPESSIPHLEQFIGSSRAARLIVPGRPVKSIHLNGNSVTDDDIPFLAQASTPVVVLGAVTNSPPVSFLQLLHRHLPYLAYLRVMSTQNMYQAPTAEFYEQVANVLASFSELNAFELSGMHWGSQRKRDDESKRVWQSSPLSSRTPSDGLMFGTDIFLAY